MNLQGTKKKGCAATMNLEWIQLYPDFQVPFHASACLLLTVFFDGSRTLLDTSWSPAEFSWSAVEDSHRFISAIADSAHLPHVQNWTLDFNWETQSAATSLAKPPIKDQQSPHAICGLGSCATARLSNLALFIMQVGEPVSLFTKKSSNYFLIQLPSPKCLTAICAECCHNVRSLLLLAGDIETNPGPDKLNVVLAELKKLPDGQATLISDLQDIKGRMLSIDRAICDFNTRLTDLEERFQNRSTFTSDVEIIQSTVSQTALLVQDLQLRLDDSENRSRRNNLIFYGLPDSSPRETYAESEKIITDHCLEHLEIALDPKDIERAHRLGRHTPNHLRPIIVKFISSKAKETILSKGPKFKGTKFSVGEDYTRRVQNIRKHLVSFAKEKTNKFSLRYKTLHIGPKRYFFDETTNTVKEFA
ncbi:uncharacterized protein [Dermacentor albipictus]|uniref:uncharacterized protein isoform X1 n=1 Tax=Dermacentor albipictus TaxID=60249 RepID=UPI0031FC94C1